MIFNDIAAKRPIFFIDDLEKATTSMLGNIVT